MKFITPDWPAPANIKAYTTTRHGWGGRKPYHDISRGNITKDNENSIEESKKLETLLQLPEEPIWLTQTHSTIVVEATYDNKETTADASYTDQAKRVCVVMTADCLPILICNKQGTTIAAIHAGWRGLAGGIIESTLGSLNQPANDLLVWLGPAIGPKKFEVGKDVFDAFTKTYPDSNHAFIPHKEGKWLANLYDLAKLALRSRGISQIYGGDFCTYTQEELFFSYRRENGKTGRMASVIWME